MIMKTKMKRKVKMIKISIEIKLDKLINQVFLVLVKRTKTSYKTFQM